MLDAFSFVGAENLGEGIVGVIFTQGRGKDEAQVFIERDEMAVERGIESGG